MSRQDYITEYQKSYYKQVRRVALTIQNKDYERLEAKAKQEGLKVSPLVGKLVYAYLNQDPMISKEVLEELKAFRFLVSNIANNVNQIAHHSNIIKAMIDENNLLGELRRLEESVSHFVAGKFKDYH